MYYVITVIIRKARSGRIPELAVKRLSTEVCSISLFCISQTYGGFSQLTIFFSKHSYLFKFYKIVEGKKLPCHYY